MVNLIQLGCFWFCEFAGFPGASNVSLVQKWVPQITAFFSCRQQKRAAVPHSVCCKMSLWWGNAVKIKKSWAKCNWIPKGGYQLYPYKSTQASHRLLQSAGRSSEILNSKTYCIAVVLRQDRDLFLSHPGFLYILSALLFFESCACMSCNVWYILIMSHQQ